ncbi:DMT family transporter [Salinispirillum marinum]|uniref:DMT family transporter n=2 Tax=Saccharospirillaceae TaxID=255527 RepID=A0ABV8BCN3_9GAMM
MSQQRSALWVLHGTVLLMGATGLFSQWIQLPAWDITAYRTWVAVFALFGWVFWRERSIAMAQTKDYAKLALLGLLLGAHWITYFHAMQVAGIAVGMISLYTYPVITVFLEPWIKGTRVDWLDVASACLVLLGIYFLVPEFTLSNTTTQGVVWGVLSAFLFALRNVLQGHWFSGVSAARTMGYQVLLIAVLMTPWLWVTAAQPSTTDGLLLILLGLGFTALTHTLFAHTLRYLKAKTVSLVACIQPVYGTVYGALVLAAIPTLGTVIGGIIIVLAAVYESVREHQRTS